MMTLVIWGGPYDTREDQVNYFKREEVKNNTKSLNGD